MKKIHKIAAVCLAALFCALSLAACDWPFGGKNDAEVALTLSTIGQGELTGSQPGKYTLGSKITLSANLNTSIVPPYKFSKFMDSSEKLLSSNAIYTFNITQDMSIVCVFEPNYKQALSEKELFEKHMSIKELTPVRYDSKYDPPIIIGYYEYTDYYRQYEVHGVIWESEWFNGAVGATITDMTVTATEIARSVGYNVTAGLKKGPFNFGIAYENKSTTTKTQEYTKGISLQYDIKEYNPTYWYKFVTISDYYLNRIVYSWMHSIFTWQSGEEEYNNVELLATAQFSTALVYSEKKPF